MILYDYNSKHNMTLRTHIGTLEFSAPEILQGYNEYSEQVDMWGAGLILYFMMSGENPFKGSK
jgi:serine/threonine protein kinase